MRWRFLARIAFILAMSWLGLLDQTTAMAADIEQPDAVTQQLAVGRELFEREWIPNDPRSHGGDGLGPVFNESSCVACHNQGGIGGAGPKSKNVVILSVSSAYPDGERLPKFKEQVRKVAPNLVETRSTVFHRFGTDEQYYQWFSMMPGASAALGLDGPEFNKLKLSSMHEAGVNRNDFGALSFRTTTRNTTALFGAGLIGRITDHDIEEAALSTYRDYPEVTGRVSRLKGQIGRFGWKAQIPSLADFTLTACSIELGLHVPEHPQSMLPYKPDYQPPGLDLNQDECLALIAFVSSLAAPREHVPADPGVNDHRRAGRAAFDRVGCAVCHRPVLGPVAGIFSDLLLHDLGVGLAGVGAYYAPKTPINDEPVSSSADSVANAKSPRRTKAELEKFRKTGLSDIDPLREGAAIVEWRTPPLWGVRDSSPYLHDGRANTLEIAILLHDGEAQRSVEAFTNLSYEERQKLIMFLKTLGVPHEAAIAAK